MIEFLANLNPVAQAFLATLFTWALTAIGASAVFATREINRRFLDGSLGFAGGVMIAASFWSLLAPAVELSVGTGLPIWLPAITGFLLGGAFLWVADKVIPHLHPGFPPEQAEGIYKHLRQSILLVLAITIHNIPEGLAVGVAFGAAGAGAPAATLLAAVALAIGIGLQNLPEGFAVSVPLRRTGMPPARSFWYGQLSGMVEPVAGVTGAIAVTALTPILPYALSFAAGAMIYVVVEEVIPGSQMGGNTDLATISTMMGFAVMTILDLLFA